jgi:amino acid transporter
MAVRRPNEFELKPALGPVQLFFYTAGVIIGAGVYSVIGGAAGIAQSGLWLSFAIGALVALLTSLSYAEVTSSFPAAGAEYAYIRRAYDSDWAAFVVGAIILFGGGATAATVAVAFGGYLRTFADIPIPASALLLLVACTALNVSGIRESSWANVLFTSIEIAGLLVVIGLGFSQPGSPERVTEILAVDPQPGTYAAAAIIFFVYLGFEEVANVSEEVRDPARDIPRAIFWGLGVTSVLYVLVAVAVLLLAAPEELASSHNPLALAVGKVWPGGVPWLAAIALFATANTVLITLIATSRLAFSMGRDGELPSSFAQVLPGRRTPWVACIFTFIVSAALVPLGDLTVLAGLSSFTALLAFLSVNATLIALRFREPDHPRPFRVPLAIGRLPVVPVAAIASILFLLAYFDRKVYLGAAAAIALSLIFYLGRKWRQRIRQASPPAGA